MRPRHYAGDGNPLAGHRLAHREDHVLLSDYSTHPTALVDNNHATDVLLPHEFGGIVNRRFFSDGHGWNLHDVRHAHADLRLLLRQNCRSREWVNVITLQYPTRTMPSRRDPRMRRPRVQGVLDGIGRLVVRVQSSAKKDGRC